MKNINQNYLSAVNIGIGALIFLMMGSNGNLALAQSWIQNGSTYTFNSTASTVTQPSNNLGVTNLTTGVSTIIANISSSDGSTAQILSANNDGPGSAFSIVGTGAGAGTAGTNGVNITLNNSANFAWSESGSFYGATRPENPQGGLTSGKPKYATGAGSIFNVLSNGSNAYGQSNEGFSASPSGGNGGNITVNTNLGGTGNVSLQMGGPSINPSTTVPGQGPGYSIGAGGNSLPWQPAAAAINAQSTGGVAAAWLESGKGYSDASIGNGGNGGTVILNANPGTYIQVGSSEYPVNGLVGANYANAGQINQVAAIAAVSYGAMGSVCCTVPPTGGYGGGYMIDSSGTMNNARSGSNGSGGAVTVDSSAVIDGTQNIMTNGQYGGNITGIIAASVGASTQISPDLVLEQGATTYGIAPASGLGGAVNVALTSSSINLPGQNSIGILATSTSDQVIIPSAMPLSGTSNSAGNVSVSLDAASAITVGNMNSATSTLNTGNISAGVLAISSTGWLFQPFNTGSSNTISSGNGGNVSVNNAGAINATGPTAIGIAALSIGNSGLVTGNGNSTSHNYIASGASNNGANTGAGSVGVANSGVINTYGSSAFGILAAANGNGGLLANTIDPGIGSNTTMLNTKTGIVTAPLVSGVVIGNDQGVYTANGGVVNVTNTGSITTGIAGGGGEASIGVLAQAVGGGGGSIGGATKNGGAAAWVGDAGGAGGAGGAITVNNSGGSVNTMNDGAIGVLAQSVGGGGGNAGSARAAFTATGGAGGSGGDGGNVTFETGVVQGSNYSGSVNTAGDYAMGVVEQSVGGGGGNGGYSKSHGIFGSVAIGGTGGSGGSGGTLLFTNNGSTISTSGDQSHGLLAQSIGGGGGNGGAATSYTVGIIFGSATSVGGAGGGAGNGGNITANNNGFLITNGNDSTGLVAQSIGGGGGNGGATLAKTLVLGVPDAPEIPTIASSFSIGGSAGGGGSGGTVTVTNAGVIQTGINPTSSAANSYGIVAQSIGGGGGIGGDASSGATVYSSASSFVLNVSTAVGGTGGNGGSGGAVTVNNNGQNVSGPVEIDTTGHNAIGILAQSIGGGGGTAGVANGSQNTASNTLTSFNIDVAVGGAGGNGGAGGTVTVNNIAANINTVGSSASGIVAQSIAGGGGNGGNAGTQAMVNTFGAVVGVGGTGGTADAAGTIAVTNSGNINTGAQISQGAGGNLNPVAIGGDSHGILAQSIAGGGGNGGSSDPTANLMNTPGTYIAKTAGGIQDIRTIAAFATSNGAFPASYMANVSVGGKGGSSGLAGVVDVANLGSITTFGHRSSGVLAQSIGGGGGTGGSVMSNGSATQNQLSLAGIVAASSGLVFQASVNVGGSGGSTGSGNTVNIAHSGNIYTAGYASNGIVAQSIGGGGGIGSDGSIAANTYFAGTAGITTGAAGALNIGLGTFNPSSQNAGNGGAVNVGASTAPTTGNINTYGDASMGIVAQSIGGGGGMASSGCTNNGSALASACLPNATLNSNNNGPASFVNNGQLMNLTINGTTLANTGGPTYVYSNSAIQTTGDNSVGIVAQSIGGGGGIILANNQNIASINMTELGMGNGIGGVVAVNVGGSINTSGNGAYGIIAQSIGGSGGILGDLNNTINPYSWQTNINNNIAAPAGGTAVGGNVGVVLSGSITVTGQNAVGIFAQSNGGGGGILANNGSFQTQGPATSSFNVGSGAYPGTSGNVEVITNAGSAISANGAGSIGIFAQSQGNSINNINATSNPITIIVNGSVNASTGVMVVGGSVADVSRAVPPNTITIGSTGSIVAPAGNLAIANYYSTTNVINNGYISGGVANYNPYGFINPLGDLTNNGTLNATGPIIVSNNSLHNYGVMKIGSENSVSTINMTGRLYQHETGQFVVKVDSTNALQANDKIIINGNAILQGEIIVKTLTLLPGTYQFLSANNVTSSATVKPSLVFNWGLITSSNATALALKPADADFTPNALRLTDNQGAVADYLQRHWNASSAAQAPLFGYMHAFERGDHDAYSAALTQISGQALNSQAIQMKTAFSTSLSNSLSCPKVNSQGLKFNQSSCVWAQVSGDLSEQSSNSSNLGFRSRAGGIRLGAQKALDNQWSTGFGLGYQQNYLTSSGLTSNGQFFDASVSLQKKVSAWSFGGSLAFAQGWFKNNRLPQLFGNDVAESLVEQHRSDARMSMMGLRFRAAHEFEQKNYYIKPYVDLDLIYSYISGYTESGGALALRANSSNQLNVAITPMIELGTDLVTDGKRRIKAYVGAGASFLPNNNVSTQMAFANGSNLGSFNVMTNGPSVLGRLNLGIQAYESDNFEVRAEYGLQAGSGYWNQQLSVNLGYRF